MVSLGPLKVSAQRRAGEATPPGVERGLDGELWEQRGRGRGAGVLEIESVKHYQGSGQTQPESPP